MTERDLQPNSHPLTGLQFPEEVKRSPVYGFLIFEKDQKVSELQRLLFTINRSENSIKAADTSLDLETTSCKRNRKSLHGKSYLGSTY